MPNNYRQQWSLTIMLALGLELVLVSIAFAQTTKPQHFTRRPVAMKPQIAIAALSGPIRNIEGYNRGIDILSEHYDIAYAHNPLSASNAPVPYVSNTHAGRIAEFNHIVEELDVDAILMARGGYGLLPIANQLPLPKRNIPIVGFSDGTVLHAAWQHKAVTMIHGPVVTQLPFIHWEDRLLLFSYLNKLMAYSEPRPIHTIRATPISVPEQEKPGTYTLNDNAPLRISGGNLATLGTLCGTSIAPEYAGTILFIEDVREEPYKIDRAITQLLMQLVTANSIFDIRGILIGDFILGGERVDTNEVVMSIRNAFNNQKRKLPPIYGYVPTGHADRNTLIPLGEPVYIEVEKQQALQNSKKEGKE